MLVRSAELLSKIMSPRNSLVQAGSDAIAIRARSEVLTRPEVAQGDHVAEGPDVTLEGIGVTSSLCQT